MPLKSISEDAASRRPVWLALSDMFLDTDTSLSRDWRVKELARSPYSLAELEEIRLPCLQKQSVLRRRRVGGLRSGLA